MYFCHIFHIRDSLFNHICDLLKTKAMDIKEFASDLADGIRQSMEDTGSDYDFELATILFEYMVQSGEVSSPTQCSFSKTRCRLTAYDYDAETESLDLFYLIRAAAPLGKVNNNRVQQGFNYLMNFFREASDDSLLRNRDVGEYDEIAEVARLVKEARSHISQLRVYVLTDGIVDPSAVPCAVDSDDGEYVIEYNVWDMQRVFQQDNIMRGRSKVEINFEVNYNAEIQCLKMNDDNAYVDAYLAIMPGEILAKIYKQYHQALLEKNVRSFLQFKGKVNKQIRKTLRERPDMFFSYNNGISSTADEIELKKKDGVMCVRRLTDWQIVNGGQTTAAIAASMNDKNVVLSRIFVPMKISVIRDKDHKEEIIKAISTSANSQTSIKNSDFSSNDPYFVDLESYSRTEHVPAGGLSAHTKWYFERTRGQYLDELGQLSGYNERYFKTQYPKNQKITKSDVLKYEAAWLQCPHEACGGVEKRFARFISMVKSEYGSFTLVYYRRLIAKCILFGKIDALLKESGNPGYKAQMNLYILAALSYLSDRRLDLTRIWEKQTVQPEVIEKIKELIPTVWHHLTKRPEVGPWAKRQQCWSELALVLDGIDKFGDDLMEKELNEDGSRLNEAQQGVIDEMSSVSSNYWYSLSQWAKRNDQLTPLDRKTAYNLGFNATRGKAMTLKLALTARKIMDNARELGFDKPTTE